MSIVIDGRMGEGGGQVVRSSLALSAVTGQPVRLQNIRGGRRKPGLLRQHLTGVRGMAKICDASVDGDQLGSTELTFAPEDIQRGDYEFQIGSAGSTVLVAQTILPALMVADGPSTIRLHGGTHAAWAPPHDYFDRVVCPLMQRMNVDIETKLNRYGFYPAGGGEIEVTITPNGPITGIDLTERQGSLCPAVTVVVADVPANVARRETNVIRRQSNWSADCFRTIEIQNRTDAGLSSGGPGNAVMIECGYDNVTELFVGLGKVGVKAEQIARSTLREAKKYIASQVPVGIYLADQLLLPMAIAAAKGHASRIRTVDLSMHSRTQIQVIQQFLEIDVSVMDGGDGTVKVVTSPSLRR